ncbi:MAG: phosphonate ABC transporter ATP-binding protein [Proteobacteria bacterium]|nr:phosphonate ABC transporter ATP-binding protein [Pseudomonadota bacterium]
MAAPEAGVTADATPVLRVDGLAKRYGAPVLSDVSLAVAPGEVVALVGASGAGKTTLFRCITRLTEPDTGEIVIGGRALHGASGAELALARREIGLVFQQFNLIRRLDAVHNVLAGRLGHVPLWRVVARRFARADRQRALAALDRVGLLAQAYQRADSLSGGQQQRVAIARVLAQESRVILADEPVASLDAANARAVLSLFREIARERGIAVLCSLHQLDIAALYADRVIGLASGRLVVNRSARDFSHADRIKLFGVG